MGVLYSPHLMVLMHQYSKYSGMPVNIFSLYVNFNYASIPLVIQNLFSPALSDLVAPNTYYYEELLARGIDSTYVIFIFLPTLIALTGIIKTLLKKDFAALILSMGILLVAIEVIMTLNGKIAITCRYLALAFPAFLIAAGYGLSNMKNKFISWILIAAFCLINLTEYD
jgi:hypothetical protein